MNEKNSVEAQKGAFFNDINPSRQFFYDPKGINIDNPSFLDEEGRVNNQSQLKQSFLNGIGNELGNISAIAPHLRVPEISVDIENKGAAANILDESLAKDIIRETQKVTNSNPQKETGKYRLVEKVGNAKGNKYAKFEDSEDQIEEQLPQQPQHPVFKQYEDDDIDLEYNFNNLLVNIENLNPELLPPPQQVNPSQANPIQDARNQLQPNDLQQAPNPVPEIPEEELLRIHNSYIDLYAYLTLFYLVLFGINSGILPPITMGIILWLLDIVVFKKRITEFFKTPATEKTKRRKSVALAIECIILAISKCYILYSLEVDPELRLSYVTIPSLTYSVILSIFVCVSASGLEIAWLVFRFVFWLQFLMVLLKLDNLIQWDWRGVFWVYWFTFFLIGFYCAGLLLILTCLLYFLAVGQIKGYQFCGLFWLFLFLSGNAGISFGIITGFVQKQEAEEDDILLNFSILGGVLQQLVMIVFSNIFKRQLLNFFRQILTADSADELRKTRREITYEKEVERNNYPGFLIMFSPTYFMTYEQKMKLKKHKPMLLKKLKYKRIEKSIAKRPELTAMNILKELESTSGTQKNLMATQSIGEKFGLLNDKSGTSVSARRGSRFRFSHELKDHKDLNENEKNAQLEGPSISQAIPSPDLKIAKVKKNIQNNSYIDSRVIAQAQKQLRREKLLEKMKEKDPKGQAAIIESPNKQNVSMSQAVTLGNEKSVLSEGDAEYVEGEQNMSQIFGASPSKQNQAETKAKEEPCNVCFEKAPDGVIMNCGHGGLCYACALEIWKKSLECFICRKPIEKILQIDVNSKKWGITKVIGSTKIVMKDVEYSQDPSQADENRLTSAPTRPQ